MKFFKTLPPLRKFRKILNISVRWSNPLKLRALRSEESRFSFCRIAATPSHAHRIYPLWIPESFSPPRETLRSLSDKTQTHKSSSYSLLNRTGWFRAQLRRKRLTGCPKLLER